ncbi:MAG: GAD-like domain-containing protein [Erythrobacter sp.]
MEEDRSFLRKFDAFARKPERYAEFTKADRKRLTGRLPELYLDLLERDGWASYRNRAVWTCDPDSMQTVKQSWLPRFPKAEIFMRSAFGDFFFWDQRYCFTCSVNNSQILYSSMRVTWFLAGILTDAAFFKSLGLPKYSNLGAKTCGKLTPDEVYIWTPAFALGGSSRSSRIERGKMDVALDLLSQIQEVYVDPTVPAGDQA